jgi:nicotinamide phosphoribosyltransferase
MILGYSADNVAFGMGGALLQHMNRDTQKFAMKASAAKVNGKWRDVFKDPVTDFGKRSKKGRLELFYNHINGAYTTARENEDHVHFRMLETVYENGKLIRDQSLTEIRDIAKL